MSNKEDQIRELPKSLQGIETILRFLDEESKNPTSIRSISRRTGISMRVAKNILLQLEKFNQIERVVEKNNILPKWRITKFGKKVLKEVKGFDEKLQFLSPSENLIHDLIIPQDLSVLKNEVKEKQELLISQLNTAQVELSKILGPVLNVNDPIFEELISINLKHVKNLKQKIGNLPKDLIALFKLKKKGEKEKIISKESEKLLLVEIFFFNSIIFNQLKNMMITLDLIAELVEKKEFDSSYLATKDLRKELRFLSVLIELRERINVHSHVVSIEDLKKISKNKIESSILEELVEPIGNEQENLKYLEDIILKFHARLKEIEKRENELGTELTDNIPLNTLYQLILDENPRLNMSIEMLESVIESLADKGYIPGIKEIQLDEDHYLKVVQLKEHDISQEEGEIIIHAIKLQKFALADIVDSIGWSSEKVLSILNELSNVGILKHSKSLLYGERWYVVSEKSE